MRNTRTLQPSQGDLLLDHVSDAFNVREPTAKEQALKAQQLVQWQQAIRDWLLEYPFTAKLVMRLSLVMVVDSRVSTACTDGVHVFINAHFASRCSTALRRFVMGHELYHVLLGHFRRRYARDQLRWNLAADAEANHRLMLDGFALPEDGVFYPAQAGNSAEVIYQWLLDHPHPEIDSPFDRHGELLAPTAMDHCDDVWVHDSDYAPLQADPDMARQITQQWQETVMQVTQQTSPGSVPAGMKQLIGDLATPRIHWRRALNDFFVCHTGASLTWSRVNRRHWAQGVYLPGRQGKALSIMVALDTSGSTHRQLPVFLSELQALLGSAEHVELRLLECDAAIHRERLITSPHELYEVTRSGISHELTLMGGGGTDFRPVFERASTIMPDCLVYLTDGHGRVPDVAPRFPVLWAITSGGQSPVSWGQVIHMESA